MISLLDGLQCAYNSSMKKKTPLELEKENRELREKIDKAIEYIARTGYYDETHNYTVDGDRLLEILEGEKE